MTRNNFHYCLKAESFKYYPSSCPGPVVWILGSSLKMKRLNLTNSGACPPRLSADLTQRSHQAPRPHTRSFLSPRKLLNLSPLSPPLPREATTQTAAAISGPSCQHVC